MSAGLDNYEGDGGRPDLMQELDEAFGPAIEKAIQRYLPRDRSREIRKKVMGQIADLILTPEPNVENNSMDMKASG